MGLSTSIYLDKRTQDRARWMSKAEDRSLSDLMRDMINERYEANYKPSVRTTCPTCGVDTELVFFADWPELHTTLWTCSECHTTLSGLELYKRGILALDGSIIVPQEDESVTFSEEKCTA